MLKKLFSYYSDKFLSRWVILGLDIVAVLCLFFVAYLLRHNFEFVILDRPYIFEQGLIVSLCFACGFVFTSSFSGIIRHTGIQDAYRILKANGIALVLLFSMILIQDITGKKYEVLYIPKSVLVIHFLLVSFVLLSSRFAVKSAFSRFQRNLQNHKRTRVLIYGAGASGRITKSTLETDTSHEYQILGFVDDNQFKSGKYLEGYPIYSPEKIFRNGFIEKHKVDEIILSIQTLTPSRKKEIIENCLDRSVRVRAVPPIEKWIHGELSARQIKPVRIEDLLEREPIILDNANITREVRNKRILVTGAAGSIGSEIARQLMHYKPELVVLLDQAESALYELEGDMRTNGSGNSGDVEFVIGDVTNRVRMRRVFEVFKPHIVYHAAAYKHVPLMESNPYEAILVNLHGTKIAADLAVEFSCEKFVLVSTDKAVNPTNVMGATKRAAEVYTQSLSFKEGISTQFITTRFGNVMGSNGSVIPLFKKQIERGGPITITHRNITRYFMTIPEACNLVLEAGAMGKGGEIFVFDMGESVQIYDVARKMVKLSGLELGKDIEVKEVGLRPGEKLYEELLANKENTRKTYHPKIMIAKVEAKDFDRVSALVDELVRALELCDNFKAVAMLKELVPEYVSNNSIYSSLDKRRMMNQS